MPKQEETPDAKIARIEADLERAAEKAARQQADIERAPEVHARQLRDAEKRMAELEEENFRLRQRLERVPPEVRLAMRVDE